jgi:WS/DGAT/MGAT family acyltransferase
MSRYAYDRLSAQDATFLWAEGTNQPMHIGGLAIYESGPLSREGGGIDIARYRAAIEGVLHWIPRYRQKLHWTPIEKWPVWVDDQQFDLGYHIRHIALPRPGSLSQLKELAARIFSRPLDRTHPLWEIWVIEGLEDGEQFAVLNKIHHCMMDGAAGADLSQILMSPSPRLEPRDPLPYMPRPMPSAGTLLRNSIGLGVRRPIDAIRGAVKTRRSDDPDERPTLDRRMRAMREMLQYSLRPASSTPINGSLGPHRRLEWLTMPLPHVQEVRSVFGATLNDVVLATVSEAMRCYLFRRRVDHRKIDFRIAAPVSVRRAEHDRRQGNHVSTWIVPLPIQHADPIRQLEEVQKETEALKQSEAALAIDTMMQAAEWLPAPALSRMTGLAQGPANMIVTNVPGPQSLQLRGEALLGLQRRPRTRAGPSHLRRRRAAGLREAAGRRSLPLHGAKNRGGGGDARREPAHANSQEGGTAAQAQQGAGCHDGRHPITGSSGRKGAGCRLGLRAAGPYALRACGDMLSSQRSGMAGAPGQARAAQR